MRVYHRQMFPGEITWDLDGSLPWPELFGNPITLWEQFLSDPPSLIAIDTETISVSDRTLLGVGVAISPRESFYITEDDPDFPGLMLVLEAPKIKKVYHNAPFDMRVLREWGVDHYNVEDTAIMCRLLNIPAVLEQALDDIRYFGYDEKGYHVQCGNPLRAVDMLHEYGVKRMDQMPPERLAWKCCTDSEAALVIYYHLLRFINTNYPGNYKLERDMIPILEETSQKGIKLDQDRREELETYYQRESSFYSTTAEGMGFKIGSNYEVGFMIADAGHFMNLRGGKKQFTVDEKVLHKIHTPPMAMAIAQMTLLYRHNAGMLSKYLRPLKGQARAYTMMHMDAVTGRISPGDAGKNNLDRNLANIPKKVEKGIAPPVRSMFVGDDYPDPESGLTRMDQSQVELRILAHLSKDPVLLAIFADPLGDIHDATERAIWGTSGPNRLIAKIFNFAMIYSYGKVSVVAENVGVPDLAKVGHWIDLWMTTYSGAARWMKQQTIDGVLAGYVETLHGRRILIPMEQGEEHANNCCINYPIQATAAEIFKMLIQATMPILDQHRVYVHDEIVFNGDMRAQLDTEELQHISEIRTPVEVEIGRRWSGD